ncbi:lysophospholipid acyltransferase family protein [Chitinibacteraceae bacterium HSL-7]
MRDTFSIVDDSHGRKLEAHGTLAPLKFPSDLVLKILRSRTGKLLRMICHLLAGLATISLRFPGMDCEQRRLHIQRWSTQLTGILEIEVRIQGVTPEAAPHHHLLVANHISWLDIFVFNAVSVSRFVAKADIAGWPIIGRLCKATGTLFIERASRRDTARVNRDMVEALNAGDCVAVFPEGTTSDGTTLLPFRSSLLQAAIDSEATVQPVYLRYLGNDNRITLAAAYVGDVSLWQSLWAILSQPGIVAEVNFLAPIPAGSENRRQLTQRAEQLVHDAHYALNHFPAN